MLFQESFRKELLRAILVALCMLSVTACGGSSNSGGTSNPPPSTTPPDDDGEGTAPTVTVSPDGTLSPRQAIQINFDMPMDRDSVTLAGNMASIGVLSWSDDEESDVLTITPRSYWSPGEQTLVIEGESQEGVAMDAHEASFEVDNAFSDFQAASLVLGQPDLNSGEPRQELLYTGANTLDTPVGAVTWSEEKGILFIPDTWDSRVLGFHGIPSQSNANADFVIGQDDFHSSRGETSQSRLRTPQAAFAGSRLLVTDTDSQRIVIYSDVPESGPRDAELVLGQPSFDTNDIGCGPSSLRHVHHAFESPAGKVLVADADNNRVLVWNEMPTENAQAPDLVIGQSSFDTCAYNDDDQIGYVSPGHEFPTARTFHHPSTVWTDDEILVVADNYNNRILIWHEFPTGNFAPADVVIGQADMESMAPNDDNQDGEPDATPSARTLDYPWSVWVENGQLFVADSNNHRVLMWNTLPTEAFQPADVVLGQPDFSSNAPNGGEEGTNARGFNHPFGVRVIGTQLFVTDTDNSRVVVFDVEE